MSENKIIAAILTITAVVMIFTYMKYGNDSYREILERGCIEKGMVLEETDFFELTCMP